MSDADLLEPRTCRGVTVTRRPEELAAIRDAGVAAVLWRRKLPDRIDRWLAELPSGRLPSMRLELPPEAVREAISDHGDQVGMPDSDERAWLLDDIEALAKRFAEIMAVTRVRLRLDVIKTAVCPKFHIDAVPARLLCTYRGAGTQYGIARDESPPDEVFNAPTGAPILLRGKRWHDDAPPTLVHRSPPIQAGGQTRLLLVLDSTPPP